MILRLVERVEPVQATTLAARSAEAYRRAQEAFLRAFTDDTLDLDDKRVVCRYAQLNMSFARANWEHHRRSA